MIIIPYIVLIVVALLFILICRFLVYGFAAGTMEKKMNKPKVHAPRKRIHKPIIDAEAVKRAVEESKKQDFSATTQIIPVGKNKRAEIASEDEEATRIIHPGKWEREVPENKKKQKKEVFVLEEKPEILKDPVTLETLKEYFIRHFLNRYGAVSHTVEQDTRTVTHYIVDKLEMEAEEAADTLMHIMVQEALQNAQRTYVMMPDETVLHMVSEAFGDVARGHRSETKTILAYDALKAMPGMEENQFNALALLLLFHYSRNTDNVNAEAFREYTKKYITPFLSELPDEYSGYQQLEYIHCISLNNKETPFGRVLYDSYPLIFAYRGCMRSEMTTVKKNWPENALVQSLYNSYYKPAAVDDALLHDFYEDTGIRDKEDRLYLDKLIHSRPVEYDRKELAHILEKIAPDFAHMQQIWDTGLLRRASLTLMGMYVARNCIKAKIGEEFDLSHWM